MKKDRNCGMQGPVPYPPYGGGYPVPIQAPGYPSSYPNMGSSPGMNNNIQEQLNNLQGQINMLDKRLTNLESVMMNPKDGYSAAYNNANYHVM